MHDTQIENLENNWNNITEQLGKYNFSDFIRIEWNSRNQFSRARELFKNIKQQVNNSKTATKYLEHLQKNSQIYSALKNENDEFWKNYENGSYNNMKLKLSLKTLDLFSITRPQSVLIAGFQALTPQKFIKLLSYIETLSIRYNIICGKSTGEQEKMYCDVARSLLQNSSLSAALKIMKKINPTNDEIAAAFEEKKLTHKKARYFLYRIEQHLRQHNASLSFEDTTLEHILPQNPTEAWTKNFDNQENTETWIERLGNLTLLSKSENKNINRDNFIEKKLSFKNSDFQITKQCIEYDQWNMESIRKRQSWLGELAQSLWRMPD